MHRMWPFWCEGISKKGEGKEAWPSFLSTYASGDPRPPAWPHGFPQCSSTLRTTCVDDREEEKKSLQSLEAGREHPQVGSRIGAKPGDRIQAGGTLFPFHCRGTWETKKDCRAAGKDENHGCQSDSGPSHPSLRKVSVFPWTGCILLCPQRQCFNVWISP